LNTKESGAKDFSGYVHTTNGDLVRFTGRMSEWKDLSEYDRRFIGETFAKLILEDISIHHPHVVSVSAMIV
jgi:hypothetical protein